MYRSPNPLPDKSRARIAESLNDRLADGLDLHSQIKVAHWNLKGPLFASLHPLFDTFATDLAEHNDAIAERAVTLGGTAFATARLAAKRSRLPEYPEDVRRDLDHAKALAERIDIYLAGLRETRSLAEELEDADTVDMLTAFITGFEKHAWFLDATLET